MQLQIHYEEVQKGSTLSESMTLHKMYSPPYSSAWFEAGEVSGNLDTII